MTKQRKHVRTSKKGKRFSAGSKQTIDLTKINLKNLFLVITLERRDYDGNPYFGGLFGIYIGDKLIGNGYLDPIKGLIELELDTPFDTVKNNKYIKRNLENNIKFDFMGREMDVIEGREFETTFDKLYIG